MMRPVQRPGAAVKRETMTRRATDDDGGASSSEYVVPADEFGIVIKQERLTRVIRSIPNVEPWDVDTPMQPVSVPSYIEGTYVSVTEVWPSLLKAFYTVFKGSVEGEVSVQFQKSSPVATTALFGSTKPGARAADSMRARSGAASSSDVFVSGAGQKLFAIRPIATETAQILPFTNFAMDNNYKDIDKFVTELNPSWYKLDVGSRQITIRVFAKALTNLLLWNEYILYVARDTEDSFVGVYQRTIPRAERELHDIYIQNYQSHPSFLENLLQDVANGTAFVNVPTSIYLLSNFLEQLQDYVEGITASIKGAAASSRALSKFHQEKVEVANQIIDLGNFYSLLALNSSTEDKLLESYQKFLQTFFVKAKDLTELEKLVVSLSVFETYYNSSYLDIKSRLATKFSSSPRVSFEKVYVYFMDFIQAVFSKTSASFNKASVLNIRPEYRLDEGLRERILQHRNNVYAAAAESAAKKKT